MLVSGAELSAVPRVGPSDPEFVQRLEVPPGLPQGQEEQPLCDTAQFGGPGVVQTHRGLNFPGQ